MRVVGSCQRIWQQWVFTFCDLDQILWKSDRFWIAKAYWLKKWRRVAVLLRPVGAGLHSPSFSLRYANARLLCDPTRSE